jgi:methionyl-tRNA synthetase
MIGQYRDGMLPAVGDADAAVDDPLVAQTEKLANALQNAYDRLALQECATLPVELARATNGYIDATAPFKLARNPTRPSGWTRSCIARPRRSRPRWLACCPSCRRRRRRAAAAWGGAGG